MGYPKGIADVHSAVMYVEVKDNQTGKIDIGTCFHLGKGLFVTARHVVEAMTIREIGRHDLSLKTARDGGRSTTHGPFTYSKKTQVDFHPDPAVDVALIQLTEPVRPHFPPKNIYPWLLLNSDVDRLSEGEVIGEPVFVLGYPPIPWASAPNIVLLRGEIAAVFEHRHVKRRHFVISGMARGGFSGGPVLLGEGQRVGSVIGVIVESVCEAQSTTEKTPEQLGFLAALSARAIIETLNAAEIDTKDIVLG